MILHSLITPSLSYSRSLFSFTSSSASTAAVGKVNISNLLKRFYTTPHNLYYFARILGPSSVPSPSPTSTSGSSLQPSEIQQTPAPNVTISDSASSSIVSSQSCSPLPPLIFLHCLLGDHTQFKHLSLALNKELLRVSQEQSKTITAAAYLLDARNHGNSLHSFTHNYDNLVYDTLLMLQSLKETYSFKQKPLLIGHSMGARTAMLIALKHPELISGIVALDASPASYSHSHSHLFTAMNQLSLPELALKVLAKAQSNASKSSWKSIADEALAPFLSSRIDRAFVLHNLRLHSDLRNHPHFESFLVNEPSYSSLISPSLGWAANIPILQKHEQNIHQWPLADSDVTYIGPSLFIGGTSSTRLTLEHNLKELNSYFPTNELAMFSGGHFVHTQESAKVAQKIVEWMKRQSFYVYNNKET